MRPLDHSRKVAASLTVVVFLVWLTGWDTIFPVGGSRKDTVLLWGQRVYPCWGSGIGLSETGTVAGMGGSLGVARGTCCSLGGSLGMCGLDDATSAGSSSNSDCDDHVCVSSINPVCGSVPRA